MKLPFILLVVFFPLIPIFCQTLVINEFIADNVSVLADQDGEYDDWIELFNNGEGTLNLQGYFLSDNSTNPTRWNFPDTTISAFGFLIVWADDDEEQIGLHTNFKLSANGESVILSSPEGTMMDETTYGAVRSDISIGRFPNGIGAFREMNPSPESANSPEYPNAQSDSSDLIFLDNVIYNYNVNFYYDNWEDSLVYYFEINDEAYIPAQLIFCDTLVMDSIGVRYKGNSSYTLSVNTPKKPFKFKFDEYKDQSFFGMRRLNFSNCLKDPSFLREKIAYNIARHYMPAPRTAYANLYFEGNLIGFYVQVEQVDKNFLGRYYEDNDGNLFKAGNFGATLEYKGSEPANYSIDFELKTNNDMNDWSRLVEFIDRLNHTSAQDFVPILQNYLNFDDAIRLLAFNMVLSNFDSYTGSGRNFYLYDNPLTDKFDFIPWDLNESFGVYTNNWNVYTTDIIEPSNIEQRPLMDRILENDSLRQVYLNYIAEMKAGIASTDSVYTLATATSPFIDAYVQADDNKLYSYQNFLDNSENDVVVGLGIIIPGLKSFSQARNANLAIQLQTVWIYPGDTDNNGTVEALDILPIGLHFLQEGEARVNGSFTWEPQTATEWVNPSATYADADGDGVVDETDIIGIGVNWGNTHYSGTSSAGIGTGDYPELGQHRDDFQLIYNSLTGSSEAVSEMRNLLNSFFNFEAALPKEFKLEPNYPNPFNLNTTIRFQLPESQTITLTIYDLLGHVVSEPISRRSFSAGIHFIRIDAEGWASGIYFYRFQSAKWCDERKMVIMK